MAITLKQTPANFRPAFNKDVWVVSSDNTGNTSFRYVADIYVSGTTGFIRQKVDADPDFSFGVFDVGRIIQDFVNENQQYDIDLSLHGFQRNHFVNRRYDIKFGEEYESGGVITVFPDLTTSVNKDRFNAIFDFEDFVDYDQADYLIRDISPLPKFLTNRPITSTVFRDENLWHGMLYVLNNKAHRLQVKTYDAADAGGSLVQTVEIDNAFVNTGVAFNKFVRVDVGVNNLNLISSGDISLGAQPIIAATDKSYTIQMINSIGVASSELRTFNIDDDTCTKFENFTFYFFNKLGQFDTFTFFRRSDQRATIRRTEYTQEQGKLNSDGTFTFTKDQAGIVQLGIDIQDRLTVNSDWLTEDEKAWLEELVTSGKVLYDRSGELVDIRPLNARFEKEKDVNGDLFNLVFEFQFGYKRTRQ